MKAYMKDDAVYRRIRSRLGIDLALLEVNALRRAELTLRRLAELACGDAGRVTSDKISGRKKGALKRAESVCKRCGLHYYHQADPKGCALYVSDKPLTDSDYSNGVACCN